ncbi:MAG TPA: hypothetical protein VJ044_01020 [Candidatus Hodarchaeales archaeon]|nr:hypothetical protein [Candidatus Hodarchaeales archaeon]
MTCVFSETDNGIKIDFETRFELINPTLGTQPFKLYLAFEKAEHPELKKVTFTGDILYGKDARFSFRDEEKFVLEYQGKEANIKPEKTGERYWFTADYSLEYPTASGFHVQSFGYPTIEFRLTVQKPKGLRVSASPTSGHNENEWIYRDLFMIGDHIQIRWEQSESPTKDS